MTTKIITSIEELTLMVRNYRAQGKSDTELITVDFQNIEHTLNSDDIVNTVNNSNES